MRPVSVRESARRHLSVWPCAPLVTSLPRGIAPRFIHLRTSLRLLT